MNFLPRCKCIHTHKKTPQFKNAANCCGLNCPEAVCIGNRKSCLGCLSCLIGLPHQVSSPWDPIKPHSIHQFLVHITFWWTKLMENQQAGSSGRMQVQHSAQHDSPELQAAHAVLQPLETAEPWKINLKIKKKPIHILIESKFVSTRTFISLQTLNKTCFICRRNLQEEVHSRAVSHRDSVAPRARQVPHSSNSSIFASESNYISSSH